MRPGVERQRGPRVARGAVLLALLALGACSEATGIHRVHESASPAPAGALPVAPRVPGPGEYVVRRGDSLYSIAFRNQIDFHELAAWNQIPGPAYTIYPGRILRLTPPGGRAPAEGRGPAPPTVARTPVSPVGPQRAAPVAVVPPEGAGTFVASPTGLGPGFDQGRWEWPTHGSITRVFGEDGCKGVDIAGTPGQIVLASAPGKVVYSGSALQGYGELIIIKHDEQYLSAYGYNRRRLVNEGDVVSAGQPIAELGRGPEQRPELHFEIRYKGRPVNPQPLLAGR